jgi:hypothetical protein
MIDVAESEDEDRAESEDGGDEHEERGIDEEWKIVGGLARRRVNEGKRRDSQNKYCTYHPRNASDPELRILMPIASGSQRFTMNQFRSWPELRALAIFTDSFAPLQS